MRLAVATGEPASLSGAADIGDRCWFPGCEWVEPTIPRFSRLSVQCSGQKWGQKESEAASLARQKPSGQWTVFPHLPGGSQSPAEARGQEVTHALCMMWQATLHLDEPCGCKQDRSEATGGRCSHRRTATARNRCNHSHVLGGQCRQAQRSQIPAHHPGMPENPSQPALPPPPGSPTGCTQSSLKQPTRRRDGM